jgi:ubiquinone/menaquinone biosynthesis C-methylase UbiE
MTDDPPPRRLSDYEQTLQEYYDALWADHSRLRTHGSRWSSGWHFGYTNPNDTTPQDPIETMNHFIGETLDLVNKPTASVLDAGCGIGATVLSLAQHYPKCTFTGLSLAPTEIALATRLQHDRGITNVRFFQGSYLHTPFPPASFDAVFALESASHAEDKTTFIREMHRLLKPRGTLLILDLIPRKIIKPTFYGSSLLQQHAVSLNTFLSILNENEFRVQTYDDLLKTRRVNPLELLYSTLWYSADAQRKRASAQPPRPLRYCMEQATILPACLLQILSTLYARYSYFVILAEKTHKSSA